MDNVLTSGNWLRLPDLDVVSVPQHRCPSSNKKVIIIIIVVRLVSVGFISAMVFLRALTASDPMAGLAKANKNRNELRTEENTYKGGGENE